MIEKTENNVNIEGFSEKEAKELQKLTVKFLKSYSKKDKDVSDFDWLTTQFKEELPNITDEEAKSMSQETLSSIKEYDENYESINNACAKGKSREQWLSDKISESAKGVSVIEFGNYIDSIDNSLLNANAQMARAISTKAGEISASYNLDGFIAEQYHVNTFNANAAAAKSNYFAEVKVPGPGETYGKNSFDVVIRDATNPKATPVHQYQVKYGKDAQATIKLLRDHGEVTKYSNQTIVVPAEQVEAVQQAFPGKTVVSEIGGTDKVPIKSNPLTKEQAKELQLDTQENGHTPITDWNSFSTKDVIKNIGKSAGLAGVQAAAITTGFSLAAKFIADEPIDSDEIVETALNTGIDTGIKAATAGAIKVCAEKGIISIIPKGTPAGIIANIACVGIENIKILSKVATGELTMSQALDKMGRTTTSMVYGLGWGSIGMGVGAAALSWIPVVGPVVGGLVGGTIGYLAGSKFGGAVYSGLKAIGKGVKATASGICRGIKTVGSKIKSGLKKLLS